MRHATDSRHGRIDSQVEDGMGALAVSINFYENTPPLLRLSGLRGYRLNKHVRFRSVHTMRSHDMRTKYVDPCPVPTAALCHYCHIEDP